MTGSYVGNAVDNRAINTVGFTPDLVIVKSRAAGLGVARTSTMAGDVSKSLGNAQALAANRIQSLTATGFTIGTQNTVNANGTTYSWVAFRTCAGTMSVGSYTGNGARVAPSPDSGSHPTT